MPASPPEELSNKAVDALWTAALDVVKDNFNAAEHLPKKVYDFLLPIAASTCQGLFSTVMMFAAAMPALSNGASVRVWNQKPSPLALLVLHMAPRQRGKSRLFQAVELLFETADDFVAKLAKEQADQVAAKLAPPVEGAGPHPELQITTKSISLQSFTMTEFFYRCSVEFPQVEIAGNKKDKTAARVWYGQAFNLDECYEFLEQIGLVGARGDRGDKPSGPVNCHASTLNTLVQRGKTKRATRTSTSYESSRTQHIALSILGNGHPSKLISMERGLEGGHTAATRERFLFAVDVSTARHGKLPKDFLRADDELPAWTWLPLTPLQATIFRWTSLLNNPRHFEDMSKIEDESDEEGYPAVLPDGVRSDCGGADRVANQRAVASEGPDGAHLRRKALPWKRCTPTQPTHKACLALQWQFWSWLLAAGSLIPMATWKSLRTTFRQVCYLYIFLRLLFDLQLVICASAHLGPGQVAARLVELSLQIREVLRGPLDAAAVASSDDSDNDIFKPVAVPCPPHSFAPPAPTQAPPSQPGLHEEGQTVPAEPDAHVPVDVPAGVLQDEDRLYHKYVEALQVLTKAFELFPRLGRVSPPARRGGDTTVFLRAWSSNMANQTQYHNEAMKCCRVSIREISKRRALWA
eukprot:s1436_g26.t1